MRFYLLFLRKSGIMSKLPLLPPIFKAGNELPPIGGRSPPFVVTIASSFFFFFFSFCYALNFLNSSIFAFSSSVYSVPLTSTISNGTFGFSTSTGTGFGGSIFSTLGSGG